MGASRAGRYRPLDPRRALRKAALIRIAFDTNLLAYSEGLEIVPADVPKIAMAQDVLRKAGEGEERPQVATQALAELHHLLLRKGRHPIQDVARRVRRLTNLLDITPTSMAVFDDALELASRHRLGIFDSIILAAAVEARCDLLLSEDLQDGFAWRGLVVRNPFTPAGEKMLRKELG